MSITITPEAILEEAQDLAKQNTNLRIQLRSALQENEQLKATLAELTKENAPEEPVTPNRATRRARKT